VVTQERLVSWRCPIAVDKWSDQLGEEAGGEAAASRGPAATIGLGAETKFAVAW